MLLHHTTKTANIKKVLLLVSTLTTWQCAAVIAPENGKIAKLQQILSFYHGLHGSASPVLTATGFVNGRWQLLTPHRINTP